MGTGALEHRRQPLGLVMERVLGRRVHRASGATGRTPRGTTPRGACAKRRAIADGARVGSTITIRGGDTRGVHGAGGRLRHVHLLDLLPDITGDTRDGGVHGRHDALGCLDALHATLAAPFVLGTSTPRLAVPVEISGNAVTGATHPALAIDTMGGMADAAEARSDRLALLREALVRTTGRFACLRGVLQAHGGVWGPARPALGRLVTWAVLGSVPPFEPFHGCRDGRVCRPRCRGHGP
jgi:hypothetical protein